VGRVLAPNAGGMILSWVQSKTEKLTTVASMVNNNSVHHLRDRAGLVG